MTIAAALLSGLALTIREQGLFQTGDTLVVALSGGADSCALLDLLVSLPGSNLQLVAAHLNHCLRGTESDGDEDFCFNLAAGYGIPFETCRVDVKALAQSRGVNLEDAGRQARITFLDRVCEKHGATAVVTAHHSDDQAETVLMRLLRGSGMSGLAGMRHRNQRGYLRPLLDVSRTQIEQYLAERGLAWREDASNRDTSFLRNRIRHELLPLLEQYNPAIRRRLTATAAILSDEDLLLEKLAEQAFEHSWQRDEDSITCSVASLKTRPAALQRRILRHACRQITGKLDGFGLEHIETIRHLLDSPHPNARVSLPNKISAVREYDRILLRINKESAPDHVADLIITAPGNYQLPGGGTLEIRIHPAPFDVHDLPADSACFDLNKLPLPWLVRTFRPGDRMQPFGMSGRKKVKDIFIDRKIPFSERKRIPLLFWGDELIWIAGVCVSEICRIDNRSAVLVQLVWHESSHILNRSDGEKTA